MRAFVLSCLVAVVIAVVAGVALNVVQQPADHAYTSATGVRL